MANWKDKWDKIPPQRQKIIQIVVGILLALGCAFFIGLSSSSESGDMLSFLIAFALVLILPRIFATQVGQPLKLLYISMLLSLIVFFSIYLIYSLASGSLFSGTYIVM